MLHPHLHQEIVPTYPKTSFSATTDRFITESITSTLRSESDYPQDVTIFLHLNVVRIQILHQRFSHHFPVST
jgi:hypothetical protein